MTSARALGQPRAAMQRMRTGMSPMTPSPMSPSTSLMSPGYGERHEIPVGCRVRVKLGRHFQFFQEGDCGTVVAANFEANTREVLFDGRDSAMPVAHRHLEPASALTAPSPAAGLPGRPGSRPLTPVRQMASPSFAPTLLRGASPGPASPLRARAELFVNSASKLGGSPLPSVQPATPPRLSTPPRTRSPGQYEYAGGRPATLPPPSSMSPGRRALSPGQRAASPLAVSDPVEGVDSSTRGQSFRNWPLSADGRPRSPTETRAALVGQAPRGGGGRSPPLSPTGAELTQSLGRSSPGRTGSPVGSGVPVPVGSVGSAVSVPVGSGVAVPVSPVNLSPRQAAGLTSPQPVGPNQAEAELMASLRAERSARELLERQVDELTRRMDQRSASPSGKVAELQHAEARARHESDLARQENERLRVSIEELRAQFAQQQQQVRRTQEDNQQLRESLHEASRAALGQHPDMQRLAQQMEALAAHQVQSQKSAERYDQLCCQVQNIVQTLESRKQARSRSPDGGGHSPPVGNRQPNGSGGGLSPRPGNAFFMADNGKLKAETPGLQYRWSPNLDDKLTSSYDSSAQMLRWGDVVEGFELVKGEWIQTADGRYLPMKLNSVAVLKPHRGRSRSPVFGGTGGASCFKGFMSKSRSKSPAPGVLLPVQANPGRPRSPPQQASATASSWFGSRSKSPRQLTGKAGLWIVEARDLKIGRAESSVYCKCSVRGSKAEPFQTHGQIMQNFSETAKTSAVPAQWEFYRLLEMNQVAGHKIDFEIYACSTGPKPGKETFLGKASLALSTEQCSPCEGFEAELPLSAYMLGAGALKVKVSGVRPAKSQARSVKIQTFANDLQRMQAPTFDELDANGDGVITKAELATAFDEGKVQLAPDGSLVSTAQSTPPYARVPATYGLASSTPPYPASADTSVAFPARLAGLQDMQQNAGSRSASPRSMGSHGDAARHRRRIALGLDYDVSGRGSSRERVGQEVMTSPGRGPSSIPGSPRSQAAMVPPPPVLAAGQVPSVQTFNVAGVHPGPPSSVAATAPMMTSVVPPTSYTASPRTTPIAMSPIGPDQILR